MEGWVDLSGWLPYRDGLPTHRRSPIQVLTGPDVEQPSSIKMNVIPLSQATTTVYHVLSQCASPKTGMGHVLHWLTVLTINDVCTVALFTVHTPFHISYLMSNCSGFGAHKKTQSFDILGWHFYNHSCKCVEYPLTYWHFTCLSQMWTFIKNCTLCSFYHTMPCRVQYCYGKSSVCPSVRLTIRNVEVSWSHRLEFFENNLTVS